MNNGMTEDTTVNNEIINRFLHLDKRYADSL